MKKYVFLICVMVFYSCHDNDKEIIFKPKKHKIIQVNTDVTIKTDNIKFIKTKTTLKKQLEKFSGKTVFIDTWFTSCGSCIKQFKYAKNLEAFFNKNDVVFLYICFGDAKDKVKWKKIINQYQLTGYHVFLENKNAMKYKSAFKVSYKKSLFHGAPRYLIIDKNGKLIDGFAPWPENKQQILDIIQTSLSK